MLKQDTSNTIVYYALPVIAVLIPIGILLSYVAAITGIAALVCAISIHFKISFKTLSYSYAAPVILFILYAASLIYTHNITRGMFDIQVKLVMLLLPLFFLYIPVTKQIFKHISVAFIVGFITTMFCHVLHALLSTEKTGWTKFYYTSLAGYQHPAYLSMYGTWSLLLAIYLLVSSSLSLWLKVVLYSVTVFCIAAVLLLGSKAGMIAITLLLIFNFIKLLIAGRTREMIILLSLSIITTVIMQLCILTHTTNRLTMLNNVMPADTAHVHIKNSVESTNAREAAYTTSISLIKQAPLLGYGCGDVQDKLNEAYRTRGLTVIASENLNAHNQYLQTTLALGLMGCLLLISWFISYFFASFSPDMRCMVQGFVLLVGINLMFESMLERQAGIMFIMFWHAVLLKMKTAE